MGLSVRIPASLCVPRHTGQSVINSDPFRPWSNMGVKEGTFWKNIAGECDRDFLRSSSFAAVGISTCRDVFFRCALFRTGSAVMNTFHVPPWPAGTRTTLPTLCLRRVCLPLYRKLVTNDASFWPSVLGGARIMIWDLTWELPNTSSKPSLKKDPSQSVT